ncbi:MGMT family protein [Zooshikella marina]|uniref:MGMT family protein n=1 Tax=Zooshikella ganghwensis TaxID=202772 RepID=UPI000483692C|nr:MGMT family protein [Zooshikella ganghwensis]MBU2707283.1 MGMT family protein [Zooshikella ganghwensis]
MEVSKHERIWQVVSMIPTGKVATYGQVARMAGLKNHSRMVGSVLSQLPPHSGLPWHRVINSKGRISFPQNSPQYNKQKQLLLAEGINFISDKVSLASYQWQTEGCA